MRIWAPFQALFGQFAVIFCGIIFFAFLSCFVLFFRRFFFAVPTGAFCANSLPEGSEVLLFHS